jgi:hypothetical protein
MADCERFVQITEHDLPDLDAALSRAVQIADSEDLDRPRITLQPMFGLAEGECRYNVTVAGNQQPAAAREGNKE